MEEKRRYTLEEAAARLVFRADDLAAVLPDVDIDLGRPGHEGGTLSEAEVALLAHLVRQIKGLHRGPYNEGLAEFAELAELEALVEFENRDGAQTGLI